MTPVSRRLLSKQIKYDLINEFWYALGRLNRGQIESFFKDILSSTEIIILSKRIEILKQLRKSNSYNDISDSIKVTEATIAKMKDKLNRADDNFLKILDYLIRDEKRRWENYLENKKPQGHGKFVGGYK